jgi:hypothetical protein
VKTPKDREIYLPDEIGVRVSAGEVPEDVRRPAERAARKAANKHTRGARLRFARPELEEEVIDRYRSGYQIRDRERTSLHRLNELYAEEGLVGFKVRHRVGGAVVWPEALRVLQVPAA